MQTTYINGIKASKKDIDILFDRVRKGLETILEMYLTKSNNIAIKTI